MEPLYPSASRYDGRPDGRQRLYRSLIRVPLYGGVEKGALGAEVGACLFVVYLYHFQVTALVVIALVVAFVHPMLALMYRRDPQLPSIVFRHLREHSIYLPYYSARKPEGLPFLSMPAR